MTMKNENRSKSQVPAHTSPRYYSLRARAPHGHLHLTHQSTQFDLIRSNSSKFDLIFAPVPKQPICRRDELCDVDGSAVDLPEREQFLNASMQPVELNTFSVRAVCHYRQTTAAELLALHIRANAMQKRAVHVQFEWTWATA